MITFAEYQAKLTHPQHRAHFELVAAMLSVRGWCDQGDIINTSKQSGYKRKETRMLISALANCGLVELDTSQESPFKVRVAACKGAELQGVLL